MLVINLYTHREKNLVLEVLSYLEIKILFPSVRRLYTEIFLLLLENWSRKMTYLQYKASIFLSQEHRF